MKLTVIVPMLNEEGAIAATLGALRIGAPAAEIIVVDGGSSDRSVEIARPGCDKLLEGPRGRARQMNAGASQVAGEAIAFVHADTIVPPTFACDIEAALADGLVVGGRFDLAFDVRDRALDLVAAMISLRSRVVRSATGDQAIFVRREVFERLGGYANIELCEDVDFARRMRRAGRVACLQVRVITSSRRWRRDGVVRTIVKMWIIKSLFLAGVSPAWLKRHYADTR
ncbi:MAG: TIGR04283 family arsenosugar biosynthesis glycosyltransferase [Candidatus Binataceae bacterium]